MSHLCLRALPVVVLALAESAAMAAPPSWVEPLSVANVQSPPVDGVSWQLSDLQIRHSRSSVDVYGRFRVSVHDADAIAGWHQLTFDSTVQRVFVQVVRGDRTLPVPRPRRDAESNLVVDLPALEPGDVIDYAWLGRQPVSGDEITGYLDLAGGGGYDRRRVRLLVPTNKRVEVRELGEDATVDRAQVRGGYTAYTWTRDALPLVREVADAVSDHAGSPYLQYSNVASWADLGTRLSERWAVDQPPDFAVIEVARRLTPAVTTSPRERAVAAADYVRARIALNGETGFDGQPRPLADVIASESGSVVERALVLAALARAMGLDATIGLAHSVYRDRVEDYLPGVEVFDTALTAIELDGDLMWIDPGTAIHPGAGSRPPPVEVALAIRRESPGLVEIPLHMPGKPMIDVTERYELADDGSARLDVTLELRGRVAAIAREEIEASTGALGDLVDLARELDPAIEPIGPMNVDADDALERVVIAQSYRVPVFWVDGERVLRPYHLFGLLTIPEAGRPRVALAIAHPLYARHSIQVVGLPQPFPIEPDREEATTDAFTVGFSTELRDDTLTIRWVYRSRASSVSAERLDDYQRGLDEAVGSYTLWWSPPPKGSPYWQPYLAFLGLFLLFGALIQAVARRRPPPNASARALRRR